MYKHSIYFVYILHIGSYIDGELHDVTILDVCVCVCVTNGRHMTSQLLTIHLRLLKKPCNRVSNTIYCH